MKTRTTQTLNGLFAAIAMAFVICVVMTHAYSPFVAAAAIPFFGRMRKAVQKDRATKMVDLDVEFISLVDVPANDLPVVMKNADGKSAKTKFDMRIISKDVKKGLVYGAVYEPDSVDLQKDFTDQEQIVKAAHNFMLKARQGNVDVQHNLEKGAGTVVESFIKSGEHANFPTIKDGAWCVVIKLSDGMLPMAEQIKGLSMYGTCKYDMTAAQPKQKDVGASEPDADETGTGPILQKLRVAMGVPDTTMAEAMGLAHNDYMAYENDDADFDWTDPVIAKVAKILKLDPKVLSALLNVDAADAKEDETNQDDGMQGDNPAATTGAGVMPQTSIDNGANSSKSVKTNQPTDMKKNIAAEKKVLKSGVLPVPGDEGKEFARIKSGEVSNEDRRELMKSVLGYSDEARERFAKTGEVVSTDLGDFESTNVLNPQLADTLLSIVVDQSDFLKKIQTKSVSRRDAEIDVMDISPRSATRITGGTAPGTGTGQRPVNRSIQVHTAEVDLVVRILNRTIRENSNLAALEEQIFNNFTLGFKNDLVDLGWNGTTDTYDGSTFTTLKRGWLTLLNRAYATDATSGVPTAQNVSVAGSGLDITDMESVFKKMKNAGIATNPRFGWSEMPYIIGAVDDQAYRDKLKDRPDGLVALAVTEGNVPKYDGNPIEKNNYIATKNAVLTPLQNLGMAVLRGDGAGEDGIVMQRNQVQKGIELIMTVQVDYFVVNPLSAVLLRA